MVPLCPIPPANYGLCSPQFIQAFMLHFRGVDLAWGRQMGGKWVENVAHSINFIPVTNLHERQKLAWISIGKTLPVSCYKSLCFSDAGKKDASQTDGSNCLVTEASNSKETSYQGSNCSTNTEHWWSEWFHCKCWRTVKKLLWINHSKAPKLRSPKFGQRCDQVLENGYILNLC